MRHENRNAPFMVKAIWVEDGESETIEVHPGDPIHRILSKPGHRSFMPSGSPIRYVRV